MARGGPIHRTAFGPIAHFPNEPNPIIGQSPATRSNPRMSPGQPSLPYTLHAPSGCQQAKPTGPSARMIWRTSQRQSQHFEINLALLSPHSTVGPRSLSDSPGNPRNLQLILDFHGVGFVPYYLRARRNRRLAFTLRSLPPSKSRCFKNTPRYTGIGSQARIRRSYLPRQREKIPKTHKHIFPGSCRCHPSLIADLVERLKR